MACDGLFRWGGAERLASGRESRWKLDCEVFSPPQWLVIGELAQRVVPDYQRVESVPTGGDWFQIAMIMGQSLKAADPVLVVDDVWTTGGSMQTVLARLGLDPDKGEAIGCVLFARGPTPPWVTVLFTAHPGLWSL